MIPTSLKKKSLITSFFILLLVPLISYGQCKKKDKGYSCEPETINSESALESKAQVLKHKKSGRVAVAFRTVSKEKLFQREVDHAYGFVGDNSFRFSAKSVQVQESNGKYDHFVIIYLFDYAISQISQDESLVIRIGDEGPKFDVSSVVQDIIFLTTRKS